MLNDSDNISSDEKILLDVLLESLLNLESYISCLCRKACEKTNVPARLKNYLTKKLTP